MAGIRTSIQLQDRMTATLGRITQAMHMMMSTCEAAQAAVGQGADAAAWDGARQEIAQAAAEAAQYREELGRAATAHLPGPVQPVWPAVPAVPVFMNAGAERFAAEFQAADQMAQQLHRTQQQITAQARAMRVAPPGMLDDVASVESRVRGLMERVGSLNRIPVNLRTGRANAELEGLRGRLSQAIAVQGDLNQAMGRMDISTAHAAYQRLNAVMDSTERGIRDNLNVQEQFNQAVDSGARAASGLGSRMKGIAMSAAAAFSIQKAIALSDSVTQTTARLGLMNDGLQSTDQLTQKIFASAQRARAPFLDTAGAIAKMGLNAGNAFSSNDELIAFMEQVNKQFVIGGASAQEQSGAMMQLSQAMAAGALRGEELNSILDAAPGIARTIEQNMGWAEGSIRQYAEKGAVSAQVVKASLLNMAEETDAKFSSIPMTFGQMLTTVQTTLLQTFWPAIQAIGSGASFINENWSTIAPILYGVAAGALAAAAAWGIYTAWQWLATGAAAAFFAALLSNPLFWIALAVGAVVAAIYRWVQSVGGLRIAWLICVNEVLSAWGRLKLGFGYAGMMILNGIDNMAYGFESFRVSILDALGNLKVKGLTILQNFVNGAIDYINKLINAANSVAGTSFEVIEHVEFGTAAAIEEQASQKKRAEGLADRKARNDAANRARANDHARQERAEDEARMERQAGIAAAQNDAARAAAENDSAAGQETAANTGSTAGSTARMADSMDMAEEDLQSMRDMAEAEAINRFTTAELTVNMGGITNQVNSQMDLDGINSYLESSIFEVLETAAEGVY